MYIDRLSKEEKDKLKKDFLSLKEDALIYKKAQRLFIICLVGLMYGGFVIFYDIYNDAGVLHYVLDGLLIIFTIIFAYKTHNMKRVELNKYAISKKDKKEKKKK